MKLFDKWVVLVEIALSVAWILEEEEEKYHIYLPDYEKGNDKNLSFACFKCQKPGGSPYTFLTPDFMAEIFAEEGNEEYFDKVADIYQKKGVSEYWIIDVRTERIYVYLFKDGLRRQIYSLKEDIPVALSNANRKIRIPLVLEQARCCRVTGRE